jgi:hypothetical protein
MEQEAKLTLLRDRNLLYPKLPFFLSSHAYRDPTVPTTQYNGLCHVTLYHTYPHRSNHQASRKISKPRKLGLFAHQPPIGLQYTTTCSPSNTKTEHKYAPWCDHKPLRMSAVSRVALLKSSGNRGRHDVKVAPNGSVLAGLSNAYVAHPICEHQLVSAYNQRRAPNRRRPPRHSRVHKSGASI